MLMISPFFPFELPILSSVSSLLPSGIGRLNHTNKIVRLMAAK